jgi:hypothetical protein
MGIMPTPLQDADAVRIFPDVPKRLLREENGIRIFLASGEFIRDHLEIGFTLGSHWMIDGSYYIPEGEVWVEETLREADREAIVFHEMYELELMKRGLGSDEAHKLATAAEKRLRGRGIETADALSRF